jgi:hypothetical protein
VRAFPVLVCLAAVCLAGAGCGSSGPASTSHPVPGGAVASAPDSAPGYCGALTGSGSVLAVGKAMNALAASPDDTHARAMLRKAGADLRRVARQAPRAQGTALVSAAKAIGSLAAHGLHKAPSVAHALVRVGRLTERPCDFPVG